jgi:hypothetical protein
MYEYLFDISCSINNDGYKKILYNKLVHSICIGNTRAISVIVNNPVMKAYNRRRLTPTTLFKEYCGNSHLPAKYLRAMAMVENINVDIGCDLYNFLAWAAKSERHELFSMILKRADSDKLAIIFEDLISDLIALDSPKFMDAMLDRVSIVPSVQRLSRVHWKKSHPNLKAVKILLDRLSPDIAVNEMIYYPSSQDNGEKMKNIIGIIWPYCKNRQINIEAAIVHAIRSLDANWLEFVMVKLSRYELIPSDNYKINPLLVNLLNASGYSRIADVVRKLINILRGR